MRKIIILICVILLPVAAFAQDTTLTVTSDGNVGIGTAAPVAALDIVKPFGRQLAVGAWGDLSSHGGGLTMFGTNLYTDFSADPLRLRFSNDHSNIGAMALAFNYPAWNKTSIISSFSEGSQADQEFEPKSIMTFTLDGKVGIGTTTPGSKLSIAGDGAIELGAGVAGKEGNAGKIAYQKFTSDALDIVGAGTTNLNRKIQFFAEGGANFSGGANFTGNVGIGTTTPAAKLHVAGGIKTDYSATVVQPLLPDAINTITHNFGISGRQLIFVTNGHYKVNPFMVGGVNISDITPNSFTFNAVGGGGGDARINFIIFIR